MPTNALSKRYSGIANCITTEVELKNPFTDAAIHTNGIWDTGATHSVITKRTVVSLGLTPISKAMVTGVHGSKEVNVYYVSIILNNNQISLKTRVTECEELSPDHENGMLIGMNIINMGDFSITNYHGDTTMSFRVPSLNKIDFVEEITEYNKYLKIHEIWMKQGNDKCPCGSKKKYKNCHGKTVYGV